MSLHIDMENDWHSQLKRNIGDIHEQVPFDCSILIKDTKIYVHKSALQLNSTVLLSGDISYNSSDDILEVEIDPEFDELGEIVSEITESFYCGRIDIDESKFKHLYKFAKLYKVDWLAAGLRKFFNRLLETVLGSPDVAGHKVLDMFTFAHSIPCTELIETCAEAFSDRILTFILSEESNVMRLSYHLMSTLLNTQGLAMSEAGLFSLLNKWINTQAKRCPDYEQLFGHVRYELIGADYLVNTVMDSLYKMENLTIMKTVIQDVQKEYKKKRNNTNSLDKTNCRKDVVKLQFMTGFKAFVNRMKSKDANNIDVFEVDLFLKTNRNKLLFAPENTIEQLIDHLQHLDIILMFSHDSVIFLLQSLQQPKTVRIFLDYMYEIKHSPINGFYKFDWSSLNHSYLLYVLQSYNHSPPVKGYVEKRMEKQIKRNQKCFNYSIFIEMAMLWCLAHPRCLKLKKQLVNEICYKAVPQAYLDHILMPTINHLCFYSVNKAECLHTGPCSSKESDEYVLCKAQLNRLRPFKNSRHNYELWEWKGELQLIFKDMFSIVLFNQACPYLPCYPIFTKTVDQDLLLKNVETSCKYDGDLMIFY